MNIEKVSSDICTWLKTDKLIDMLAQSDIKLTNAHIERAIKEAGTNDFNIDDVNFKKALFESELYNRLQRVIESDLDIMSKMDKLERKEFFKNEFIVNRDYRDKVHNEIKSNFKNLLFYKQK